MNTSTTNGKASMSDHAGLKSNTTNGSKFSAKSTLTEAQYERILAMLRTGEKSTIDFRRVGIMAPAARIKELNARAGCYIPTVALRDVYDDQGFRHSRVAFYELVNEPERG